MGPAVLYPIYLTFNKTDISPRRTHSTAEMPTSGDLKSAVYLFLTTPNGFPRFQQIDPAPNGNDLWHYMKSYMRYILSKFTTIVLNVRNNLWQWLNTCKNAPETVLREKFKFRAKNGLNHKLRHRKAQKMSLSGRYGDPHRRAGDRCCIRESWHEWYWSQSFPVITSWL